MKHSLKVLCQEISHSDTMNLIQNHVKDLNFDPIARHLTIGIDNAAPLHDLNSKECDYHLRAALEKVYGDDITYELKLGHHVGSEREKAVPHMIRP